MYFGAGFCGGFGFFGGGAGGLCVSPWVSALATRPTYSLIFPPPAGPPGSAVTITAVTTTPLAKFQTVKRNSDGTLAGVVGNDIDSGDNIVGVSVAAFAPGQPATVVQVGFIPGTVPAGPLYRDVNGLPVPYSSLPVPVFPATAFTNQIGVGSALGLDVQIYAQRQVTP